TIKTGKAEEVVVDQQDPYQQEDAVFVQAIKSGSEAQILSTYQDAYNTQRLTEAASVSVEENKSIHLDD
ncbi:MAG: hypothetical protein ACQER2_04010, partial [Bacillota bacterium]